MPKPSKKISAYVHRNEAGDQVPDTAPGPYYVSVKDGPQFALASGPYATHTEALALVDRVRDICVENDGYAHFHSYGTVRCKPEVNSAGALQRWGWNLELTERAKKAA
jgi:hypothetical protein